MVMSRTDMDLDLARFEFAVREESAGSGEAEVVDAVTEEVDDGMTGSNRVEVGEMEDGEEVTSVTTVYLP
jgi:hypothetical protein